MKTIFYALLLTGLLFTSCGDDDEPGGNEINCAASWTIQYSDELNAVTAAATTYGMAQTQENCEAFQQAYLEYIDALEDWADCANQLNLTTSWQAAIDQAEMEAANIC